MLSTLVAASGLVNTYPVSSFNLSVAVATDGAPQFFEPIYSDQLGVEDGAACYGVGTSDGDYVFVGNGLSVPQPGNTAFAVKMSSRNGQKVWAWDSGKNADDAAIGVTRAPRLIPCDARE